MKIKTICFFVLGLAIGSLAEAWRFNLVASESAPWASIIIGYFIFLCAAYALLKKIKNNLLFYVIFAILGIVVGRTSQYSCLRSIWLVRLV